MRIKACAWHRAAAAPWPTRRSSRNARPSRKSPITNLQFVAVAVTTVCTPRKESTEITTPQRRRASHFFSDSVPLRLL